MLLKKRLKSIVMMGVLLSSLILGGIPADALEKTSTYKNDSKFSFLLDSETKSKLLKKELILKEEVTKSGYVVTILDLDGDIYSEFEVEEISTEKAIENLMENKGINYGQAKKEINESMNKAINKYSRASYSTNVSTLSLSWMTVTNYKTHTWNTTKVQTALSADLLAYRSGSFGSIEDVKAEYFRVVNSSNAYLESSIARHKVGSFPTLKVPLAGDGVVAISTTYSIAAGLEDLGFSIQASAGGSYIARKSISHSWTYSI